jgi:aspartate carbamoyltransferase catalytic subunit
MSSHVVLGHPASRGAGVFFGLESADHPRHLLGLEGMSRGTILEILERAERYRAAWRTGGRVAAELSGVEVVNAFFENSTRTRVSFELAAKRLGAVTVSISETGSSIAKGESLLDTLRAIVAMGVDLVVVRHRAAGAPAYLAEHLEAGVINAGDGAHEHPTQALLDLLTLRDAWKDRFEGRRIAIVGDIAHSRVARSALFGLHALGARVTVAGPGTLVPRDIERLGCTLAPTVEDAMAGADAVMALRIQSERMEQGLLPSLGEYARVWGITRERVQLMKPDAVVLHPGPMNRGVEITPEVADGERSVIFDQVENGVAIRCAVLGRCAAAWGARHA